MEIIVAFLPIIWMLFIFCIVIGMLLFTILTSIWTYRDALRKGNSKEYAMIALVATLFFPIIGLIVYLVIRNDKPQEIQ